MSDRARLYAFLNHIHSDIACIRLAGAREAMVRVLLAESNKAIREFIAGILAECGHDVRACENGVEATVWLATSSIDVLVTDMALHGGQGLI
jgi:CheY-like chemotaxis protein